MEHYRVSFVESKGIPSKTACPNQAATMEAVGQSPDVLVGLGQMQHAEAPAQPHTFTRPSALLISNAPNH